MDNRGAVWATNTEAQYLFIVSDDTGYRDFAPYGGDGAAYLLALPVVSWVGNRADALHDGY